MKSVYRRYALAGATFSVAISIGFLMQSSEASQAAIVPAAPALAETGQAQNASLTEALSTPQKPGVKTLPKMPNEQSPSASFPKKPVVLVVSKDAPVGLMPQEEAAPALGCDSSLTATTSAAAMVELHLVAPCQAGQRVTINHEGMRFTEILGPDGHLEIRVPALAETALFAASFADGDGAVASVVVESLAFYDRSVVQWKGRTGLELHAREFGADYGSSGHVWSGAPRDLTAVIGGEGGFHLRLGNDAAPDALMAEVYTYPSGTTQRAGEIALTVEAEIAEANCGQRLSAQSIEVRDGMVSDAHELFLEFPGCDAAGEFLVLKNLLQDLTIAQN